MTDKNKKNSIEHVYPQTPKVEDYWEKQFNGYDDGMKRICKNMLGNLLLLNRKLNSKQSNKNFKDKCNNKDDPKCSYIYGTYAEKEVAEYIDWNPNNIILRSEKMVKSLNVLWGLDFDEDQIKKLIGSGKNLVEIKDGNVNF